MLICDPPQQTATELSEGLRASRSAIGNAVAALDVLRFVLRSRAPGERAERIALTPGVWMQGLDDVQEYAELSALARRGLEVLGDAPPARRAHLLEAAAFADFLRERLPALGDEGRAPRRAARLRRAARPRPSLMSVTPAILAEDLQALLRRRRRPRRPRPARRARHGVRAARPQRRRQDDAGADPRHAPAPHRGRAGILGHDVVAESLAVRRRIGLAGQFAAVDEELTGRENVEMVGRLYRLSGTEARARANEILERFGLTDAADRPVSTYSGGMRRRLDLSASLAGRPAVLLLDEPTTGLDPRTRQELWDTVDRLRREGTSVLLTTQYLEEVAADGDEPLVDAAAGEIRLVVGDPSAAAESVRRLDARGLAIAALALQQPSLDDVFLTLTGRRADDDGPNVQEAA